MSLNTSKPIATVTYNGVEIPLKLDTDAVTALIQQYLGRGTKVTADDPNYSTLMARGIALTSDTSVTPTVDGSVVLYYT